MELITKAGQVYPLKVGVNTIGRAVGNDIVLDDRSMSRRHAELHWDGQRSVLTDLGSTNGTFVGGQRLAPHQPQPVSPGVRLSFGPTMIVTLAVDAGDAATADISAVPIASPEMASGLRPGTASGLRPRAAGLDLMFRALDVALDRRKLVLASLGFLVAAIAGALLSGVSARVALDSALVGIIIGLVGVILLWCILTFVMATLSRLIFRELSEGKRDNVRAAVQYTGRHFLTFLLSPLVLLIGLALIMVGEFVFLLLGRIEYGGELAVSLAFLPLVILNLVVILVAWFGTALTYPIVADRGGGIGDTISCVLTLVRRAPGRLVAYMMLAGLTSLLMFVFFLYLIFAALYATSALTIAGMGADKFLAVISGLPLDVGDLIPGLPYGAFNRYWLREPPVTFAIARFLLGLCLLGLVMVILAIPQMFYLSGTCAAYLDLRGELPGPRGEVKRPGGNPPGGREGQTEDQKRCWLCGAPLAHDQTYCPTCKQLQR